MNEKKDMHYLIGCYFMWSILVSLMVVQHDTVLYFTINFLILGSFVKTFIYKILIDRILVAVYTLYFMVFIRFTFFYIIWVHFLHERYK